MEENPKIKIKKNGVKPILKIILILFLGIVIFTVLHYGYTKTEEYEGEEIYEDVKES